MITERMQQSRRQKAARGELYESFPPGYICRHRRFMRSIPDERVQRAIETVLIASTNTRPACCNYTGSFEGRIHVAYGPSWQGLAGCTVGDAALPATHGDAAESAYAGIYARGRLRPSPYLMRPVIHVRNAVARHPVSGKSSWRTITNRIFPRKAGSATWKKSQPMPIGRRR